MKLFLCFLIISIILIFVIIIKRESFNALFTKKKLLLNEIDFLNQSKENLDKSIEVLKAREKILFKEVQDTEKQLSSQKNKIADEIKTAYQNKQEEYQSQYDLYTHRMETAKQHFLKLIESDYQKAEKDFSIKTEDLQQALEDAEKELQKLKDTLAAGAMAQLREDEKKKELDFYKVSFPLGQDGEDLKQLLEIRKVFHRKDIISKLIWTTFFQKQVTELCNRVLLNKTVCGIYKITNIETQQVYIGQSVNITERWKQHCKCGLGIDNPASNKLYNNMLQYGLWNFTFELVEECPRELLNEKEKLWIDLYQSDSFGLNSNKGVSRR